MFRSSTRMSFFKKNLFYSASFVILSGIILVFISYSIQNRAMMNNLIENTIGMAHYSKDHFTLEDVNGIMENHDTDGTIQLEVKRELDKITELNHNIAQSYILDADIIDNAVVMHAMYQGHYDAGAVPGDLFELPKEFADAYAEALKDGKPVPTAAYTDVYGDWISVLDPIYDENGKAIAMFGIDVDISVVKNAKKQLITSLAIVLLILSSITVTTQYIVTRKVFQPLTQLFQIIKKVGDGHFNERLNINRHDEIGQLSSQFDSMIDNMSNMIRTVQNTTEQVSASSEQLLASSENTKHASTEIASAIQEVANGNEVQLQSSEESTNAIREMAMGVQSIADASSNVSEKSQHTVNEAVSGNDLVQHSITQINRINSTVGESAEIMKRLEERSKEISVIIDTITSIAEQTNLLALNAAIESARAGEHGRGFAVVADEVRKLAEQSHSSAEQIVELVKQIQDDTKLSVEAMNEGISEVHLGITAIQEVGDAFQRILDSAKDVEGEIQEVSATSEEMSASSEEITAAMEQITSLSQQSAQNSQRVAAASEEQLSSMEEVSSSAAHLSKIAEELQTIVGKFKV
ncbi:methyl-accepting chemotaxis protein [Bacillus chungangensis]|uniref:Methyl-accepting chemotaxis protein n=2 Tax=Bacillus chungangensis TaxID=587633 RepID=A0ABT9WRG7_9BACI|nr:methyl-accepting chemotaxis protein [Bacillus chungangensis]MDQ0175888.1 methyl-accepting chemotaxis protein [Bacillus chungangensis]